MTVAHQAPLSMGFPSQEYWSGLPFPSPGDLPDSGIKPTFPALAGGFFTSEPLFQLMEILHSSWRDSHGKKGHQPDRVQILALQLGD